MPDATISIRDNGPYLLRGSYCVIDADGNEYEVQEVTALCRCGHSANKPFCDGTHKAQGFESTLRAK